MDYTSWEQPIRLQRWNGPEWLQREPTKRGMALIAAIVLSAMALALAIGIATGTPGQDTDTAAQASRGIAASP